MLAVSWRGAAEDVHSVEVCEYAEAETDHVEKDLVENQTQKAAEDRSGTEARFGIAVIHFGIGTDRSETEVDHLEIEGDRPEMAEVRSGMEVRNLAPRVDLDTAEVAQMVDYACQAVQIQAVAEGTATVEVEQTAKAAAEMEIPVAHTVGEMMSRLSY